MLGGKLARKLFDEKSAVSKTVKVNDITFTVIGMMKEIAFFSASLVGVVFGVYPAHIAANLDPIEALRYE